MTRWIVAGALLAACAGEDEPPPRLLDTGWFDDGGACAARVEATVPEDGTTGWYWRDPLAVIVADADGAYDVRLLDAGGRELPVVVAADDGGLRLDVRPEAPLAASTEHTLQVTDCLGTREVRFVTSALGAPLVDGPGGLARRTWALDAVSATWVEPGGFGAILAGLLGAPILFGVRHADARVLDLLGGLGVTDAGRTLQDRDLPTWTFPLSDFAEAPYFETTAERVELVVESWPLPIVDLRLSGTFSADGSRIGGVVITGVGDTRYAGGAVARPNQPGAVCDVASGLGVRCVPCGDGAPYCLAVEIRDGVARELPGVTMVPVR